MDARRPTPPGKAHQALAAGLVMAVGALSLAAGPVMATGVAPTGVVAGSTASAASWCSSSATPPTTSRPGQIVVADNFESGSLTSNWLKTDEGDAWAGVTTAWHRSGLCAGRLIVTSSSTSRASIRKNLPSGTDDVWAAGWFRVNRQGYSGSNVPTFRFFDGSQRILDVHRQNISGELWLRTASGTGSWRYVKLNRRLELYQWYKIEVHVRPAWGWSAVSVWLNGGEIYRTSSAYLPTTKLTTVLIGSEHVRQVMDLAFDDVVVTAS